LDERRIVHLCLVDGLLILGGVLLGCVTNGDITKKYPILWGARMILKVWNHVEKFEPSVLSFSFSRNAPRLKVGRDIYKWICKDTYIVVHNMSSFAY
jgi:hypothetical protein